MPGRIWHHRSAGDDEREKMLRQIGRARPVGDPAPRLPALHPLGQPAEEIVARGSSVKDWVNTTRRVGMRLTTCDALRMLNKEGVTFHSDGRWDRKEAEEKLF